MKARSRQEPERRKPEEYVPKDEEEAEKDRLAPSRWWFSSTLVPLIAGTFGPLATVFNLCALDTKWRLIVDPNSGEQEGQSIADPAWITAINAVSLAVGIIGNVLHLGHMAGRLPFGIAQPVTIISWFISSFLLIGLVAAVPSHAPLPAGEPRTLSQAYYYAILAAVMYALIASMMITTAVGVFLRHYSREYKLSLAQRTLMVQTVAFLGYILAAAAVYSRVEGWEFLDAVYYVDVTLLTIGFGDFKPVTHTGRALFFPMAIGGILFLGLIIASIRTTVLQRGSTKVTIRILEKARQRSIMGINHLSGTVRVGRSQKQIGGKASELEKREQEFNLMRDIQKQASWHNRLIALSSSIGAVLILWLIGAVVFYEAEKGSQNWSYFESLYFTYVSLLTIGYGDFYPQTNSAKPSFVLWSLIALPTITVLIGAVGDSIVDLLNTITLWIGDHIPAKTAGLKALKESATDTKKGQGGAFEAAKPPGFMPDSNDGSDESKKLSDDTEADAANGVIQDMESNSGSDKNHHQAAAGKHYRPYLLLRELQKVFNHIDASPPRKYTYAEWTWFLKLLGQDESASSQHRSTEDVQQSSQRASEESSDGDGAAEDLVHVEGSWSWLGGESPLVQGVDEPRWVYERLVKVLERELRGLGDERVGK
ncbi:MAG: Potassium channel [Icmadophila ericetorum]|nr:Potassium channel [Icmadophila ericetorum]